MPSDAFPSANEPAARLSVRLLGVVEVILDGRRLAAFDSLRLQRFLALLALRRDPQHRSRLAFELWPDSSERQARTNLRKLVHEFRQALPDADTFVQFEQETVQWNASGPSEVDALRFRDALAAGDADLAARTYSGDLLPACYDEWVLEEREKLQSEAHAALVQLAEEAAARGDQKATLKYAQRISELDPVDEAAARLQIGAHLELGDRATALRCYHRHAEALERELGVAPADAVEALYAKLRSGAPADATDQAADLVSVAESPFIGRESEWQRVNAIWRNINEHGPHLVLITGEPGIGKSRLAQELGRAVRSAGHIVASSRAYEAAGRLPWGPIVELLRSDALRNEVGALDDVWRAELARLLPELSSTVDRQHAAAADDPVQRHRLFDAVKLALGSGDRPRLLVIDDLQWCDAETIDLIGFVVSAGQTAPILIVGTVRSEEVPDAHPLNTLIDALHRDRAVTTLALSRFDRSDTATLASRLLPADALDSDAVGQLWQETEGNPLFVIETLRARSAGDPGDALLTPTMRTVLGSRLEQLTAGARQLAEVAAVFGRPFSSSLMASIAGIDEAELVENLDELWRRRIVREHGPYYDFSHDRFRAVTLETLSPVRRRGIHRAVADELAERRGDTDAESAQIAAHYDQGGMVDEAIDAYRRAGSRAVAVSALDEAVTAFRRALTLLSELPASTDRDQRELDIRVALGSPLVALEGYGSRNAHMLYERSEALCRRLRRPISPPILRGLGLARLQGCRFEDCSRLAQALLDHDSNDPIARTEGHYLLGVSAFWQGDLATARDRLTRAIETHDVSHGDVHLAYFAQDPRAICLVRRAWADLWAGDTERADQTIQSAHERATELDHLMTQAYVITYSAIATAELEDAQRLRELLADADRVWERTSERYLVVVLDALRGWLDVCEGSTSGLDMIVESVARSRSEGETLHLTYTLLLLARARSMVGELHEGRAAIREALSWTRRTNQRYLEAELLRVDGELAYRSGDADAAAALIREAVDVASAQGAGWLQRKAAQTLAGRFTR